MGRAAGGRTRLFPSLGAHCLFFVPSLLKLLFPVFHLQPDSAYLGDSPALSCPFPSEQSPISWPVMGAISEPPALPILPAPVPGVLLPSPGGTGAVSYSSLRTASRNVHPGGQELHFPIPVEYRYSDRTSPCLQPWEQNHLLGVEQNPAGTVAPSSNPVRVSCARKRCRCPTGDQLCFCCLDFVRVMKRHVANSCDHGRHSRSKQLCAVKSSSSSCACYCCAGGDSPLHVPAAETVPCPIQVRFEVLMEVVIAHCPVLSKVWEGLQVSGGNSWPAGADGHLWSRNLEPAQPKVLDEDIWYWPQETGQLIQQKHSFLLATF